MGGKPTSMEDQLIDMRMNAKQLGRSHRKCEENEKKQKKLVKKALEQGNLEGAKIYAENAIRERNTGLNYLRLQARVDAVAARIESSIRTQQMSETMGKVVQGMNTVW